MGQGFAHGAWPAIGGPAVRNESFCARDVAEGTPLWLSVKGNPADPEINVLAIKSIASPLWNTIANVFRLPKTLVQELTGKK